MRARCCGDPERVTATTEPRGGGPYNTCYTDHIIYITGERAPGLAAWLLKHPQQRGRGRRHQELVSLCREPCVWGRAGVVFQGRELCDCLARSDVGVGAGDMLARAMVRHDAHIAKRNENTGTWQGRGLGRRGLGGVREARVQARVLAKPGQIGGGHVVGIAQRRVRAAAQQGQGCQAVPLSGCGVQRGGAVLVQAVGVGSWGRNAIGNCHANLACSLVHWPRTHVCMLAGSLYRS